MPLISIVPSSAAQRVIQFVPGDSSDILLTMDRAGCGKADIYRDGAYLMTAWKDDNEVWSLYCRTDAEPVLANEQGLRVASG